MNKISKIFLITFTFFCFSLSINAGEKPEQRALKSIKNVLLKKINTEKIEKRINQKVENIKKSYSRIPMSENMVLGLSILTRSIIKNELSYTRKTKGQNLEFKLKEEDISLHFSFSY